MTSGYNASEFYALERRIVAGFSTSGFRIGTPWTSPLMHGWPPRDTVFEEVKGLFMLDSYKVGQMMSPRRKAVL